MPPHAINPPAKRALSERVASFVAACAGQIEGECRADRYNRMLYSTDASLYQLLPHAVVIPRTTDDVVAAVALAAAHELPILPRAAGTSLAGQAVNEALVIDFSRHLDAILEVNAEERWARVQPGVVLDHLNSALRRHSLQFGPDPASSDRSTIGGAVANNATGSHSLIYGMTAAHVRGVEVVLSDGATEVYSSHDAGRTSSNIRIANFLADLANNPETRRILHENMPRYWRRCGGYNLDKMVGESPTGLAQLICGSEGTLAVMTEIAIDLVPVAAHSGLGLLHFDRLDTALAAVPAVLETSPTAVELLDPLSLRLCRDVPEYARLLASVFDGWPTCLLVVEYQGESEAAMGDGLERLASLLTKRTIGATALTRATDPAAVAAVWRVRKVGLGLLMSMKGDLKPVPFIEDAAVPVENLYDYVHQIEEYCAGLDTPISYYAHAGAGCLHIRPLINRRAAAEVARMPDIARFAAGLVRGYGGALSSEHGDGRSRSWLNEMFYGPEVYDLFRQLKTAFDPHNRMNPGIIVDAAPLTESLRALPYSLGEPRMEFDDYNRSEREVRAAIAGVVEALPDAPPAVIPLGRTDGATDGFVRAVEMCNGCGVCRKSTGTMCPSFMVTREEEHSTRGRANALRAAMAGVLPAAELTSERMYGVMDLCISCKGCKAECPSGVDMARIKTEFLARYYEEHGTPLRAHFFAHSATLNRLGSGWRAPLANLALQSRPGRWALGRVLQLAPQRALPRLARVSFNDWWAKRRTMTSSQGGPAGRTILMIDPLTNYNYPEIGIAAVEFLTAIGVRVVDCVAVDDGRPAISKGVLGVARKAATATLRALRPAIEAGCPIVGLEPSSLLTLRDEYPHLLPGDLDVAQLASLAVTFEEYVAGLSEITDLTPLFTQETRHILLHGHCHQKAIVGTGPARRVLTLPPNYTVEEVDSGCCGMAGSFGYEAEHYEISMKMGERSLLPAVRTAAAGTIVASAGVSCRQQIADGSGRVALHPAQILRNALVADNGR